MQWSSEICLGVVGKHLAQLVLVQTIIAGIVGSTTVLTLGIVADVTVEVLLKLLRVVHLEMLVDLILAAAFMSSKTKRKKEEKKHSVIPL